ncbi:MAG: nitrate- and nitrite sensing domain-containing protein [Magnetococcales bacterium]|nr:nitrate- and nitrite sensing domain-containing protein [Magnetococcales bacterium]
MPGLLSALRNIGIKGKLALMLLPPILCLVYFIGMDYQAKREEIRELERLSDIADVAVRVGEAIHLLQKERGRTAIFVTSGEGIAAQELKRARELTDARLDPMRNALPRLNEKSRVFGSEKSVQAALDGSGRLKGVRDSVDGRRIDEPAALRFYTEWIGQLIQMLDDAILNERWHRLHNRLQAYIALLHGKEMLGQLRAQVGAVLQLKALPRDRLVHLAQLEARHEEYVQRYLGLETPENRTRFQNAMEVECVHEVRRVMYILFQEGDPARAGLDAAPWFERITCKMDQFKEIEDRLVSEIQSGVSQTLTHQRERFFLFAILNGGALGVTLALVLLIARHLTTHTRTLVRTMRGFSEGDQRVRMTLISGDELGHIGATFNEMAARIEQSTLQEKANAAREREESERFRHRVRKLRDLVIQVAGGDLTRRGDETGEDELAILGSNVNIMIGNLAEMVKQTDETVQSLSTALEQVHGAVQAQSSGAAQQAAAINETTTTLEEIRAVASQTLEKAQALGRIADQARGEGERGNQAARQTLLAMDSIRVKVGTIATTILALSEKIGRIGEITMAVNNLAQQSKMLALNASIEAAKAGEAGKGFAVVADEVKNLADQSQQFTTQVQRILEEIRHATDKSVMATEEGSKEVDAGASLTEQAGAVVKNLLDMLKEVAIAGQQIVAAVRQEAAGIDQIGAAMNEINHATTQSVTSTRQTAQAIENLSRLSVKLRESIRFRQA